MNKQNKHIKLAASSDNTGNRNYSETYTYDTEGRLSSKGGVTLTYNDAAHVHAVSDLGTANDYSYDANRNQTQQHAITIAYIHSETSKEADQAKYATN